MPAVDQITAFGSAPQARAAANRRCADRTGSRGNAGGTARVSPAAATPYGRLEQLIARLSVLHPERIELGLERMQRLLARLDHPQRKLAPVIHVAGTNGKGSSIAYLRAITEAAGLTVHVYTSPSLVRLNERFRIGCRGGGLLVSDDELFASLERCERANAGEFITIFEIETAAALCLFAEHPADLVLLEVGLGGRTRCYQRDRRAVGERDRARQHRSH